MKGQISGWAVIGYRLIPYLELLLRAGWLILAAYYEKIEVRLAANGK
jgi:hypothetical protein